MKNAPIAVALTALWIFAGATPGSAATVRLGAGPVVTADEAANIDAATTSSVAYQANTIHSGFVTAAFKPPLKVKWSVNLGAGVGYPVYANGTIVVAANGALVGIDATTGAPTWTEPAPTGGGWVGPAFDRGNVFSNVLFTSGSSGIGMFAFNAQTGAQVWSAELPGQYVFSSPPTAAGGTVYTGGAGSGGTLYAYAESSGHLNWHASVENGDSSSPVVTKSGVFVSYACPQTYQFNPHSGAQVWHYSGPCEGGGGSTGVLHGKLLYVGDSDVVSGYNGIALTAAAGQPAANFNSELPPAFNKHLGFFITNATTLTAVHVPKMTTAWSATIPPSDAFATPPFVVGKTVYVVTEGGALLGYTAATGAPTVQMSVPVGTGQTGFAAGLGYGGGELIVPAGSELVALTGS
jgi:outer membrane protein assembly factor BamB